MEVEEALLTRQSVYDFKPDAVSEEDVRFMLEAAVRVPNHRRTHPWRFYVVQGEIKERLAQIRHDMTLERAQGAPRGPELAQQARAETQRVPLVIFIVCNLEGDEHRQEEDIASCHLAGYAIQMAAWARGIGCRWGTGGLIRRDDVRELLGLFPAQRVVTMLWAGHAAVPQAPRKPLDTQSFVHWLS